MHVKEEKKKKIILKKALVKIRKLTFDWIQDIKKEYFMGW